MNAKSDEAREAATRGGSRGAPETAAARGSGRKRVTVRDPQYLIAPAGRGFGDAALRERIGAFGSAEIVRNLASDGATAPPVAVVRIAPEKALALLQSSGGSLVIEADEPLRAALLATAAPTVLAPSVANASGPGFTTTIQVMSESEEPLPQAEVQLIGQQWTAQGATGPDGKVALTLHGELPNAVTGLLVEPRANHWGLWRGQPALQTDAVNAVTVRALSESKEPGWGARAMQLDGLPAEFRARGTKIALIDTGVAASHRQLRAIERGFDASGSDGPSWSQDQAGHGTLCAGIIAATTEPGIGVRGYAPEAELHVCKLAADARCSDLVAALDYCVETGIDVACIGFGCPRGSAIVEQRIESAKQRGVAVIAAAGNAAGPVQFPACSRHVLAVGALGQMGTFPEDSPHAVHAAMATTVGGGLFAPAFACQGLELDLCAPGMAVISCQSPDGFAVRDGTSVAASHVAALAALVLAHHTDFQRNFAQRDARRVERLFQILKATAQPLENPVRTGAGLPNAPRALGFQPQVRIPSPAPHFGLEDLRHAMRLAGLGHQPGGHPWVLAEPPRGPAMVANLPLSFVPPPATGGLGFDAAIRDLTSAMRLAGLHAGR
jgi:subtilisin